MTRIITNYFYKTKRSFLAKWWSLFLPTSTHYYINDGDHFLCFSTENGSYFWADYRTAKLLGRLSKKQALALYLDGYGSALMAGLMVPSLKDFLIVMLNPLFWFQHDNFCPEWDLELRELLLSKKFVRKSVTTIKFNHHLVWVANHPYGSFTKYVGDRSVRPKRTTIALAKRYLQLT